MKKGAYGRPSCLWEGLESQRDSKHGDEQTDKDCSDHSRASSK